MKSFRLIAAVLALCAAGTVQAQTRVTTCSPTTPNNAICIDIAHAATMVDGSPTVLPITTRIEQRLGTSGAWSQIAAAATGNNFYVQNLAPGTYFFRGYDNCTGAGCIESLVSNTVSKAATANPQQPNPPAFTIAVVIGLDHAPVYKILSDGKRGPEVIGFVPVGKPCTGNVVFTFRTLPYRHVAKEDVKFWRTSPTQHAAAPCAQAISGGAVPLEIG